MQEIGLEWGEEPDDKVRALVREMARHHERPMALFWIGKYVELLGLTLEIEMLETALKRIRGRT